MKEGWEYKKIGEVFQTFAGGTPLKQHKEYYEGGNIPWLRSGEVCQKYIDHTEMFITQTGLENSSAKYFPVNTVVVAMYGATAAQVGILKIKSTSNQAVCGLLPNDKYLPEFIYYWFVFSKDSLAAQAQGGAQPNISQVKIRNILFPLLSLPEQRRIVSYLDAAFAKIDAVAKNAEDSLNDAKALFQSALTKMMEPKEGWEEKALKMCSTKIGDGLHGTPKYDENGEYYFINGNNLDDGKIEISNTTKRVNIIEYNKNKVDLNENSVLLSINGTIGKTAFYNDEKIILGKSACYINVIPILKKEYLRYFFLSKRFLEYAKHNVRQATIMNLGLREIREMKLFIPPISTQQTIVATLDSLKSKVDQLQSNFFRTLAECAALKQSILRQTFE